MTTKIYCELVSVTDQTRDYLIACYHNHMDIYNQISTYHHRHQDCTYKDLKAKVDEILEAGSHPQVVRSALCNEIYYLHKKQDFLAKSLDDIQYLSGIANANYRGRTFVYEEGSLVIRVTGSDLPINLHAPLPKVDEGLNVYINLSYSGDTDVFELSVFTTPDLNKNKPVEQELSTV